jgi:3',5'-cyclic-AMP phosphodiesterase
MKFVILTDTHLVPDGRRLYALDPARRLEGALHAINRDHDDLAFVILTGDLAHWGEQGAYEALKDRLAILRIPVVLMVAITIGANSFAPSFRAPMTTAMASSRGSVTLITRQS